MGSRKFDIFRDSGIVNHPFMNREDKGFTLIEMMVAAALFGLLCIMVVQFLSPMTHFFQRSRARQDANLQLRMCFGTIDRLMANGKASTLIVSTPPTTPTVQNSSATFQSVDGSFYTITWSPAPMMFRICDASPSSP